MNIEFKKLLDNAVKTGKINTAQRIEIETEYCYIQVYTPNDLPKYVRKITKELSQLFKSSKRDCNFLGMCYTKGLKSNGFKAFLKLFG